ncbi:MAG: carotenoid 1,2-hydratase [Minwuia sp.]|uniref:carotenoid 1,2-hydratase n=1 Tax=Minwuia sp. TaxID=2493630 RepID=UPI003A8C7094
MALYGNDAARWSMTERPERALTTASDHIAIGPSSMTFEGDALTIDIDERAVPLPRRIRGQVRLIPEAVTAGPYAIHPDGRHAWWPVAPVARIEVDLDAPVMRWQGHGYFDCNAGDAPLEQDFARWDWSRHSTAHGTVIHYDTEPRGTPAQGLALGFDGKGEVTRLEAPPLADLPATLWRVRRRTRAEAGSTPQVLRRLEDAPFYARTLIRSRLYGEDADGVHETLDGDRLRAGWVWPMLPFRMPRTRR